MPDDDRLRRMAAAALRREVGMVDVEAGAVELQRRLAGGPAEVIVADRRRPRRRWALGVAAAALVVVAAGAVLSLRGTGDTTSTPPTSAPVSTPAVPVTSAAPSSTTAPPLLAAAADPSAVRVGEAVTVTPSAVVTRTCQDIVTALRRDGGTPPAGQLVFGEWQPSDNVTAMTVPGCLGTTSAAPVSIVIPPGMPPGVYDLCLGDPAVAEGCAPVTIQAPNEQQLGCLTEPTPPPSLVDGSAPGPVTTDNGSFVRWGPEGDPNSVGQGLGPADELWLDDALTDGRAIVAGTFQAVAIPVGDPPISQISIYLRNTADGCVRTYAVGPGLYTDDATELARRWVDALATGGVVDAPEEPALGVEYYGRRRAEDPPYFEIDRFGADGSIDATLSDAEVGALFPSSALPDGSTLTLAGGHTEGRCENRPLESSGGSADLVVGLLPEGRSLFVTDAGVVLVGRDVCEGARWGDPGTRWELVGVDLSAGDPTPVTLLQRDSDASAIQYDDGDTIIAFGEMFVENASADGRYVSAREPFNSDQSKWHVLDLRLFRRVELSSSCPIAGDIVGPPSFLDDGTAVVARLCAAVRPSDALALQPIGDGDVQVEAVDLDAPSPGGTLIWSASRPGVHANGHTRTVVFDATVGPDGEPWAIVTGNGDMDQSSESFVFHGTDTIDVTRIGFHSFAFDPASLIRPGDVPPS